MAAITHSDLRAHWRDLKRGRPGHRFQDRYERARKTTRQSGRARRIGLAAGGIVCVLIGLVLSVIPGPAIPFFLLGGAMLATESRRIARFMDWSEVRLRKLAAWAKRRWRKFPTVARVLLIIIGAGGLGATAYLGFRIMHG
jgi:hypothetical protein